MRLRSFFVLSSAICAYFHHAMLSPSLNPRRIELHSAVTTSRASILSGFRIPLACAAAIPLLLLCSCDQKPKATATPAPQKKIAPPLAPRFKAACDKTAAGKYDEAAEAFAQINAENDPSQPLYNWIQVHRGLALMMSGKDEEARALFGKLEDAGLFSTEADDKKLAKFFVDLGTLCARKIPSLSMRQGCG